LPAWLDTVLQSRIGARLLADAGPLAPLLAERAQASVPLRFVQNALAQHGNPRVSALAYCFCGDGL